MLIQILDELLMSGEMQEPDRAIVLRVVNLTSSHYHQTMPDDAPNFILRPKPVMHGKKMKHWTLTSGRLGACNLSPIPKPCPHIYRLRDTQPHFNLIIPSYNTLLKYIGAS